MQSMSYAEELQLRRLDHLRTSDQPSVESATVLADSVHPRVLRREDGVSLTSASLDVLGQVAATSGRVLRKALAPAPRKPAGVGRGALADLTRSKQELLAENAFLRHQILVAARRSRKPRFRTSDRVIGHSRRRSFWLAQRSGSGQA
jgi:hypothetical protein